MIFHHEVDLFESPSLDKVVERKVAPRIRSPQTWFGPSTTGPHYPDSSTSPQTQFGPSTRSQNAFWCTFHKTKSHAYAHCEGLINLRTNKNSLAKVVQPNSPNHPEVVSLNNSTKSDPL